MFFGVYHYRVRGDSGGGVDLHTFKAEGRWVEWIDVIANRVRVVSTSEAEPSPRTIAGVRMGQKKKWWRGEERARWVAETICIIFSVSRDLHKRIRIERRTNERSHGNPAHFTNGKRHLQCHPTDRLTIIIIVRPTAASSHSACCRQILQRNATWPCHRTRWTPLSRANQHDDTVTSRPDYYVGGALHSLLVMACHPNPIKLWLWFIVGEISRKS